MPQSVRRTRNKLQRAVKSYRHGGSVESTKSESTKSESQSIGPLKANTAVNPKQTKVTITGDKFNSFKTKIT
jgi:hypothetical protein